ncbi:MAG TPA: YkgJ family cysteine cluster protein [Kofleriaceae bacterium]|nr:YkgJ family cysteine cluster protein [Kofleriaceae bacterium]
MDVLDCRRCGACCVNLPANAAEGFVGWVEVEPGDRLLDQAELARKLVVRDADGVPHLKLAPDGRCLALRGRLGERVRCDVYHHRPSPCRRVQAGDPLCRRYRQAHGLDA